MPRTGTPKEQARENIDRQLEAAGWHVQDRVGMNLGAGVGVVVREFTLDTGEADYLLFVNREACGVIEAKPEDFEPRARKMVRQTGEPDARFAESAKLEEETGKNLKESGYQASEQQTDNRLRGEA